MNYDQLVAYVEQLEKKHIQMVPSIRQTIQLLSILEKSIEKPITQRTVLGSDPDDYPREFQHGDWDCTFSPTKYCMYTYNCGEDCIFCGQPEERK